MSLPLTRSVGLATVLVAAIFSTASSWGSAARPEITTTSAPMQCRQTGELVTVAELPEGSGIAASRRIAGRFWSHNDSGEPELIALDTNGKVTGRLRLEGAAVEDWEALSVGPCPAGSCLYVGDIGDNDAERRRVTVYRIVEPPAAADRASVEVFHASYPDGAHDAETLLVDPGGRLHIVTKGDTGPVAVYRFPAELRPGSEVRLERMGQPRTGGGDDRITDGAVSPDGQWTVLRTRQALLFHRTSDLLSGSWRAGDRVSLEAIGEPQGEGVTFAADGSVVLVGEGGGKKRPGTFTRLSCTPPGGRR